MRFLSILALLVSVAVLVSAWSKEDHELFRVRDELNTLEGSDTSFYALLGLAPTASLEEINKQNKKRARQLHPDKAVPAMLAKLSAPPPVAKDAKDKAKAAGKKPGVTVTKGPSKKDREAATKEANTRYQLFSVIVAILKNPQQRERYDHFLRNGFPAWRGTGYYFTRYRPGLSTVLAGLLIVFGGAAHYGAMLVGYQRQRRFVERYVERARSSAWGSGGVPGLQGVPLGSGVDTPPLQDEDEGNAGMPMAMNRRQKRWQDKEDRKRKDSPAARPARSARDRNSNKAVAAEGQTSAAVGVKKRVQADNGKTLIVDSVGNVYLEEVSEEGEVREFLLDPDEIQKPTFSQTALIRLPIFVYKQSVGRAVAQFRGTPSNEDESLLDDEGAELTTSAVGVDQNGTLSTASAANPNEEARLRRAKVNGNKAA